MSLEEKLKVKLGGYYLKEDGSVWRVVGIITEPAVCLREVGTDKDDVVVVGSLQSGEFTELRRVVEGE